MATLPPMVGAGRDDYRGAGGPFLRTSSSLLDDWADNRLATAHAKLRTPIVLGSERIMLAAQRCEQLKQQADQLRDRYLNLPSWSDPSVAQSLEERVARLQTEIHGERLALWTDLRSLMETISDAGVERMRTLWLNELTQLIDGSSQVPTGYQGSLRGGGGF